MWLQKDKNIKCMGCFMAFSLQGSVSEVDCQGRELPWHYPECEASPKNPPGSINRSQRAWLPPRFPSAPWGEPSSWPHRLLSLLQNVSLRRLGIMPGILPPDWLLFRVLRDFFPLKVTTVIPCSASPSFQSYPDIPKMPIWIVKRLRADITGRQIQFGLKLRGPLPMLVILLNSFNFSSVPTSVKLDLFHCILCFEYLMKWWM